MVVSVVSSGVIDSLLTVVSSLTSGGMVSVLEDTGSVEATICLLGTTCHVGVGEELRFWVREDKMFRALVWNLVQPSSADLGMVPLLSLDSVAMNAVWFGVGEVRRLK